MRPTVDDHHTDYHGKGVSKKLLPLETKQSSRILEENLDHANGEQDPLADHIANSAPYPPNRVPRKRTDAILLPAARGTKTTTWVKLSPPTFSRNRCPPKLSCCIWPWRTLEKVQLDYQHAPPPGLNRLLVHHHPQKRKPVHDHKHFLHWKRIRMTTLLKYYHNHLVIEHCQGEQQHVKFVWWMLSLPLTIAQVQSTGGLLKSMY